MCTFFFTNYAVSQVHDVYLDIMFVCLRVSCGPGHPEAHSVVKITLNFLFSSLYLLSARTAGYTPTPSLGSATAFNEGSVHARQALYQQSCMPSPLF